MLTIEVELLTGRYAATAHNDRMRGEWPPHPARFFSALVAALHDDNHVDDQEREALLWLETRPDPPSLDVDLSVDETVGRRQVLDLFVPVNDVSIVGDLEAPLRKADREVATLKTAPDTPERRKDMKRAEKVVEREKRKLTECISELHRVDENPSRADLDRAIALLPDRRTRQVRAFPVIIPARPTLAFCWTEDPPAGLRAALDRLCARVTRLGHSSSMVRCLVTGRLARPSLVPDEDGDLVLRVVGPGQLQRLEREFARHQAVESRVLPARPQRYARPASIRHQGNLRESVFSGDWVLFERVGGAQLLSSRGTDLARALRAALIEQAGDAGLPAVLSGHRTDGSPADHAHVAFVSLPFVGHEHADGSVKGCAIVLPRALSAADREALFRVVASWEKNRAVDQEHSVMELASRMLPGVRVRRTDLSEKRSLRPSTWSRPARRFVTATPIALDRNPGNLRSREPRASKRAFAEAERCVADACEHIGLPKPSSVEVSLSPLLSGAQPVRAFPPWPGQAARTARVRVHAEILFPEPVRGPLLLGAGRYFGLGLCLPIAEDLG
jgi:CRISPR-associated protein Csb2